MLGQRCGNLKADIFFKHFCRLQDSSMPEVSSTNTRINASKIYKSFAGSFFTIRVLSSLDYTNFLQVVGLDFDLSNSFKSTGVSITCLLSLVMLHLKKKKKKFNFRNIVPGMGLTVELTEVLIEHF